MKRNSIKRMNGMSAGLLVLGAILLGAAFWETKPEAPAGWVTLNRQLEASLDARDSRTGPDAAGTSEANLSKSGSGAAANDKSVAVSGKAGDTEPVPVSGVGVKKDGGTGGDLDKTTPAEGMSGSGSVSVSAPASPGSAAGSGASFSDKIDINSASEEQLDRLPGIGAAKAKAIVDDRDQNGPFRSISDLKRVKGIGPKMIERMEGDIVVLP
jgi:competence protein ComEA